MNNSIFAPEFRFNPGKPQNLLEVRPHDEIISELKQLNIPPRAYELIGELSQVGETPDLSKINAKLGGLGINRASGLLKEDYHRVELLDIAKSRVYEKGEDMVVFITDMTNLKGLNDKYGETTADIAIKSFAQSIHADLEDFIIVSGKEIRYAVVNVSGEGSDTMKVVLFGKDLKNFAERFYSTRHNASSFVKMTNKEGTEKTEEVKGDWGYSVSTKDDLTYKGEKTSLTEHELGDFYNSAHQKAYYQMAINKIHTIAQIENKVFDTSLPMDKTVELLKLMRALKDNLTTEAITTFIETARPQIEELTKGIENQGYILIKKSDLTELLGILKSYGARLPTDTLTFTNNVINTTYARLDLKE